MAAKLFETSSQFSLHIEELAASREQGYLETILEFCDENFVEYEEVAKLISASLKQKIFEEARLVYSMPKETSSRIDD